MRSAEEQRDYKTNQQTAGGCIKRLLLVEFGENKTADNTRCAPSRQDETIDLTDIGRTERVCCKSWHDGKTAAKTRQQITGDDREEEYAGDLRKEDIEKRLTQEHDHIDTLTADFIGDGGPEKAAQTIENRCCSKNTTAQNGQFCRIINILCQLDDLLCHGGKLG